MNRKATKPFGFAALTIEDENEDDTNQEITDTQEQKTYEEIVPVVDTVVDEDTTNFQTIKKKSKPKPKSKQIKAPVVRTVNKYWDKLPEPIIQAILVLACYDRYRFISFQYYNAALICVKLNQITQSLSFWRACALASKFMTNLEINELVKPVPIDKQARTLKNAVMRAYFKSQIPSVSDYIYEYSYQHRDARRYIVNHGHP